MLNAAQQAQEACTNSNSLTPVLPMDQSSGSKRPAGVRGRGEVVDVVGADKQKVITDDAVLVQAQKKRSGTLHNAHSADQAHVCATLVTVDPSLEVAGTVQKVVGGPDDGLGMLVSKPPGKSGYGSLMGDSGVPSDGEDQRDKRKKTIRKHFTDIEQQARMPLAFCCIADTRHRRPTMPCILSCFGSTSSCAALMRSKINSVLSSPSASPWSRSLPWHQVYVWLFFVLLILFRCAHLGHLDLLESCCAVLSHPQDTDQDAAKRSRCNALARRAGPEPDAGSDGEAKGAR